MGNSPCFGGAADPLQEDSDAESQAHKAEHGSRPEEWRIWFDDTPMNRQAFNQATERMQALAAALAKESNGDAKGFKKEDPRVDQYFCADPRTGPKAATRDGVCSMEVKKLQSVSSEGSENWEKATGADISVYYSKPWVSLQKTRNRCKAKKIAKGTRMAGLKALEATEIKIVTTKIFAQATGMFQPLRGEAFLTMAIEGTPAMIAKAAKELKMEETLKSLALANSEGKTGLHAMNVSYPRFISLVKQVAAKIKEDLPEGGLPEGYAYMPSAQEKADYDMGALEDMNHGHSPDPAPWLK